MKMNKKGFTLIELLVVVLIIGILASIALPQYFKAVEKSKSAEALSLFGSIGGAQQRYYLVNDYYTTSFGNLDLDFTDKNSNVVTGSTLGTTNFTITLVGTSGDTAGVKAERSGGRYPYTVCKFYNSGKTGCKDNSNGICTSLGNFNDSACALS